MPDNIYVGNFSKGLKLEREAFVIDNDSFPTLFNSYVWRGRVKKKPGSHQLGRLEREVVSVANATPPLSWQYGELTLVAGSGNLITDSPFDLDTLSPNSSIAPGTLSVIVGANTYTDPALDGILVGVPAGSGTINYATGAITIAGGGAGPLTGTFSYFPSLPVMGIEDYDNNASTNQFPDTLFFDTVYAYEFNQASGIKQFYSVSYYKATNNPVTWSGENYQQFWTANYRSAFWATNGKKGFHFVAGTYVSGSGTTMVTFNFTSTGAFLDLIVGDKLWFNEWNTGGSDINGLIGTVSTVNGAGQYVVTFGLSVTVSGTGIAQTLTCAIPGEDGIRWYDGDMTNGTGIPANTTTGWVNFSPPLTAGTVSIDGISERLYYLVGAKMIVPFKDRLIFFSPVIQASTGAAIEIPFYDTAIFSWNGTPFYNAIVPTITAGTETFDERAYYVDQIGFGGYQSAGISMPIETVIDNEDVLLVGFGGEGKKTRFVYTGNDLQPFLFYLINSELPSSSTFSGISLDRGGVEIGQYGITMTTQQTCQRIDLDIPDEVFNIQALNHGYNRVNGVRDFFREFIYFNYPVGSGDNDQGSWKFPTRSFLWNYRDNTWSILKENYTTQGIFREENYYTWETIPYDTWNEWVTSWDFGQSGAQFPNVAAGTPQGYVLIKDASGQEGYSASIQGFSAAASGAILITNPDHCLEVGDYIYINFCVGFDPIDPLITPSINEVVAKVVATPDANTFEVSILDVDGTGFVLYNQYTNAYIGLGQYLKMIVPYWTSKMFNVYWEKGRQIRLGTQKYLFDRTPSGQVTCNIFLSQDTSNVYNVDPLTDNVSGNFSLVSTQLVYTCPENAAIGLNEFTSNLNMPTASNQNQIWHRCNTSLIGDSFQVGFTLSDAQMRNYTIASSEITFQAMILTVQAGPLLC